MEVDRDLAIHPTASKHSIQKRPGLTDQAFFLELTSYLFDAKRNSV